MNLKTIVVQAPVELPTASASGETYYLHVDTTDGVEFRWVSLDDCPVYIRSSDGQRAHLTMSLKSNVAELPKVGKTVLTFEELLVPVEGGRPIVKWKSGEWEPDLGE